MCHRYATSQDFLSPIYDVVSAHYSIQGKFHPRFIFAL